MGLPGFGLEALADVTHGGAWHIGVFAAPGIPQMLLAGHEREFLQIMYTSMCVAPDAVSGADIDEFARSYSRPQGWLGAAQLYRSMLREGDDIRAISAAGGLKIPVLAIGAGAGQFTANTMVRAAVGEVHALHLEGVGHYAALEAPDQVAAAILDFVAGLDCRLAL